MGKVIERTPITPLEARALALLSPVNVSYPVGSPQKRFARDMQGATAMSEKQRAFLWRTAWSYRRQYVDAAVLAEAERLRPWALAVKRDPQHVKHHDDYAPPPSQPHSLTTREPSNGAALANQGVASLPFEETTT